MRCNKGNIKKRYAAYAVIFLVWLVLCVIGYVNANHRFPAPVEEYYEAGDTVEYLGMEITAEELTYEDAKSIRSKYAWISGLDSKEGYRWFVVRLKVKNISDKKLEFEYNIVPNIALTANPIGYNNQGRASAVNYEDDLIFMPDEEKEVIVYFSAYHSPSRPVNVGKLVSSDIYLDMSIYPEHKAIVFHGARAE